MTGEPWQHPDPRQSLLRLVEIPTAALNAWARGEGVGDPEYAGTPYLLGPECIGLWVLRSRQIADSPADIPWVTRLVVIPGNDAPVGLAGFHGQPDGNGMVEVGYRIDPVHRRKGHARQALETLLAVARAHPDVRVVRAAISPGNIASRTLVRSYGFEEVGEQWDDEDGVEIIFEVAVPGVKTPAETGSDDDGLIAR